MAQADFLLRRVGDEFHDMWMATAPGFISPAESPVGYGTSRSDAVQDLIRHPRFQYWLRESGARPPSIADFDMDDHDHDRIWEPRNGKLGNFMPAQDPGRR